MNGIVPAAYIARFGGLAPISCDSWPTTLPLASLISTFHWRYFEISSEPRPEVTNSGCGAGSACTPRTSMVWRRLPGFTSLSSTKLLKMPETSSRAS
jgi:hypothetical protein